MTPGPDAPSEEDTGRDGFLSYAAEWHSLAHGIYAGMKDWKPSPGGPPDIPGVQKEPHYYKGGFVIGTLIQLLVVLLFILFQFGVL